MRIQATSSISKLALRLLLGDRAVLNETHRCTARLASPAIMTIEMAGLGLATIPIEARDKSRRKIRFWKLWDLRHHFVHDVAVHIRQPEVAALVEIGQLCVVDANAG